MGFIDNNVINKKIIIFLAGMRWGSSKTVFRLCFFKNTKMGRGGTKLLQK